MTVRPIANVLSDARRWPREQRVGSAWEGVQVRSDAAAHDRALSAVLVAGGRVAPGVVHADVLVLFLWVWASHKIHGRGWFHTHAHGWFHTHAHARAGNRRV